jgi:hypothetical protein
MHQILHGRLDLQGNNAQTVVTYQIGHITGWRWRRLSGVIGWHAVQPDGVLAPAGNRI